MSQPTRYNPSYDFTNFQSLNPSTPLPADRLEIELNAIETTLDGLCDNIALIQRDDGKLKNLSVHKDALNADVLAMMGDWNPRGDWLTATVYVKRDMVEHDDVTYVCVIDHTSGTFVTDYAAGKWMPLLANAGTSDVLSGTNYGLTGNAGDNVTTQLASAFSAAASKVLVLPPGTHTISGTSPSAYVLTLPQKIHVKGSPGSTIKLANGCINNTDANQYNYIAMLRSHAAQLVHFEDVTFDGNRDNQLYPLSSNTPIGRTEVSGVNKGPMALVEFSSDGTTWGDAIIFERCTFKNGYWSGLSAMQSKNIYLIDCIFEDCSFRGLDCEGVINVRVIRPRTKRNGAFVRASPDNGWDIGRGATGDRPGLFFRFMRNVYSLANSTYPIAPTPSPDYGQWNEDIWVVEQHSEEDCVEALFAHSCFPIHVISPIVRNVGKNCTTALSYRPGALWLEDSYGTIQNPIMIQEKVDGSDQKPEGIVCVTHFGEAAVSSADGSSRPDGMYDFVISNPIFVCGQDFDTTQGNWNSDARKKNNWYRFMRLNANTQVIGGVGEGYSNDAIIVQNANGGTATQWMNAPFNVHVSKFRIRNGANAPVVLIRQFSTPLDNFKNLYFDLDVEDIRLASSSTGEEPFMFHWGTDLGGYTSSHITIKGRYDCTANAVAMSLMSLRSGTGSVNVRLGPDLTVINPTTGLCQANPNFGQLIADGFNILNPNRLVYITSTGSLHDEIVLRNGVATGVSGSPFSFNSTPINRMELSNLRLTGSSNGSIMSSFAYNVPRRLLVSNVDITEFGKQYTPSALSDGAGATQDVTGNPFALFDRYLQYAYTKSMQGVLAAGHVHAAGNHRVRMENETGGSVTLAAGDWRMRPRVKRPEDLEGVGTATLSTINAGASTSFTVTVTGAVLGDFVTGIAFSETMSPGNGSVLAFGYVSAANTVTVILYNLSGNNATFGAVTRCSKVLVTPFTSMRLVGSSVYGGATINDGDGADITGISVTDLQLGEFVYCSFTADLQAVAAFPYPSAAGTGAIRLQNESGGNVTLSAGTFYFAVDRV